MWPGSLTCLSSRSCWVWLNQCCFNVGPAPFIYHNLTLYIVDHFCFVADAHDLRAMSKYVWQRLKKYPVSYKKRLILIHNYKINCLLFLKFLHYKQALVMASDADVIMICITSIWIFTHLKLCLADAIHNFKWVKIVHLDELDTKEGCPSTIPCRIWKPREIMNVTDSVIDVSVIWYTCCIALIKFTFLRQHQGRLPANENTFCLHSLHTLVLACCLQVSRLAWTVISSSHSQRTVCPKLV